jgi:hypothetical protein
VRRNGFSVELDCYKGLQASGEFCEHTSETGTASR